MAVPLIDDDWSANSTESTTISLVRRPIIGTNEDGSKIYGHPEPTYTFHPTFTHQLFGEQEQIFGYKGLDMEIQIAEDSLFTHYQSSYEVIFPKQGDTEADDVEGIWREVLEPVAFDSDEAYATKLNEIQSTHHLPPGKLIKASYVTDDERYEIWKGKLNDRRVFEAMAHIDFLNPLMIDGGSTITEEPDLPTNDNWSVFFMYRRHKHNLTFVGYSTVWSLFYFTPPTAPVSDSEQIQPTIDLSTETPELNLPVTRRIAQFVILPPFQRKGLSHVLYSGIYSHYRRDEQTRRITVESPSNAFDDLRDICDLAFIRSLESTPKIVINTSYVPPRSNNKGKESVTKSIGPKPAFEKSKVVNMKLLKALLPKTKMAPRQFWRVVEMHLMSHLPPSVRPTIEPVHVKSTAADIHQYRLWSLLVKERLLRENADALSELEPEERVHRLNETLKIIGEDYSRILEMCARAEKLKKEQEDKREAAAAAAIASGTGGKRKVDQAYEEAVSKRVRTGDATHEDESLEKENATADNRTPKH